MLTIIAFLSQRYVVTVVTPFDYMEVSLSVTMAIASGANDHAKIIFPTVREDGVDYIKGTVTELSESSATLSNGQTVSFDVCILATGQRIPLFMPDPDSETTIDARKAAVGAINQKIASAGTIVVAGGGPIGCEVAADIKIRNASKK
jgi:pyruvate/2-oxoglutarate dehydrogenase complex dihydrolipoamide dehydrogenase (E3) component